MTFSLKMPPHIAIDHPSCRAMSASLLVKHATVVVLTVYQLSGCRPSLRLKLLSLECLLGLSFVLTDLLINDDGLRFIVPLLRSEGHLAADEICELLLLIIGDLYFLGEVHRNFDSLLSPLVMRLVCVMLVHLLLLAAHKRS